MIRNCKSCGAPIPKFGSTCSYCETPFKEDDNEKKIVYTTQSDIVAAEITIPLYEYNALLNNNQKERVIKEMLVEEIVNKVIKNMEVVEIYDFKLHEKKFIAKVKIS